MGKIHFSFSGSDQYECIRELSFVFGTTDYDDLFHLQTNSFGKKRDSRKACIHVNLYFWLTCYVCFRAGDPERRKTQNSQ